MEEIGRNRPCPCGSGKKYKLCCMVKSEPVSPKELTWKKLRAVNDRFSQKISEYGIYLCGSKIFEKAWKDFILDAGREYEKNSRESQLFIPWLLYNWNPKNALRKGADSWEKNLRTIAESYLSQFHDRLQPIERRFIELAVQQPYSFYEIIECKPGSGFKVKDLLLEAEIEVIEKSGSRNAQVGTIIYGQIIQYEAVGLLVATAPIFLDPIYKIDIIRLRKIIQNKKGAADKAIIRFWADDIRALYFSFYERIFTPPTLVNTDDEPLVLHDIYYEIDSPQAVFDQLKTLALEVDEQELLNEAKFDANNQLQEVEFSWLKRGNRQIKSWKTTVLGHIFIDGRQLKVSVNSKERADTIKNEIARLLKGGAVYQRTEIQAVESLVKQARPEKQSAPPEPLPPEALKMLDQQLHEQWKGWLYDKIPALGNISPMEAIQDPDGREMVKALLDDLALKDLKMPPQQKQKKYIDWARQQLGLV